MREYPLFLKEMRPPPVHKPRDLVGMRDWLSDQWLRGDFRRASELGVLGNTGDNIEYADTEGKIVTEASLFWMTTDMCDILNAVAARMPNDVELNEALLIDEAHTNGFLWFEKSMIGHDAHNGSDIQIDALSWGKIRYPYRGDVVPGIGLSWYQFEESTQLLMPLGRSDWLIGTRVDDEQTVDLGVEEGFVQPEWRDSFLLSAIEDRKALASILALSTQKNISDVEHDHLDRPMRRRRERENRPPATVRIIRLRGSEEHGEPSEGASERTYTHRWIVDPHWRNQPYGPGRSLRRPQLIPAHVKGPKDAPLILKDKVRVIG